METSEIIDGLEDLIQDRKSFATPANDKFYGKDNPFRYDIEVLQAAIDKLSCRAEPENKIFTVKQLKQMSGDPVWIKKLTCPELSHWIIVGGYDKNSIFSTAGGEYPITFYAKTWLPYARKPEGSEKP